MSSVAVDTRTEAVPAAEPVDMTLEVVRIGVTDVDRAKAFYQNLGWRFDYDITSGDAFRIVQMTPHKSEASIIFGKGIRSAAPGLADSLVLAVDDIDAAREDLIARGVEVSEVFHYSGGPFSNTPLARDGRAARPLREDTRRERGRSRRRQGPPASLRMLGIQRI